MEKLASNMLHLFKPVIFYLLAESILRYLTAPFDLSVNFFITVCFHFRSVFDKPDSSNLPKLILDKFYWLGRVVKAKVRQTTLTTRRQLLYI